MKRPFVIAVSLFVGVIALWYYFSLQPPSGVEPKGDGDSQLLQWLTLAISIVSLLNGIVGLLKKLIEIRTTRQSS